MPIKELYHGTNTDRLEKIKKEGLDPKALKASSGENFVYLTDHPEVAALFSGFGHDKMGMRYEGYMAPLEGKRQNGVVLKVRVDSKLLKPDRIWGEKLKKLENRDKMIADLTEEIREDMDNQVMQFWVDDEAHKLAKKEISQNPDLTEDDLEWLTQDYADEAADIVAKRQATKEVDGQLAEMKKFAKGKLYQCANRIPPEAIVEVIPAKKFLPKSESGHERNFGSHILEGSFLVRAESGEGWEIIKWSNKILYHGSPKEIKNFDVKTGDGRYGKGLYLTPDLSIAKFYAEGGRQGNAGQKLNEGGGFIYEFKVSGDVFEITDEHEAMYDLISDHPEAEAAYDAGGERTSSRVTKYLSSWVASQRNCQIIWMNEKDAGVLSPLNQVLVLKQAAIKSVKPYVSKKKKSISFLVKIKGKVS